MPDDYCQVSSLLKFEAGCPHSGGSGTVFNITEVLIDIKAANGEGLI